MARRFDAVLLDAGGVLVLPDPTVLAPLLAYYGGDPSIPAHRRAHYGAMAAKSAAGDGETEWSSYTTAYLEHIGVDPAAHDEAGEALERTRGVGLWRWPIPESLVGLGRLAGGGVPMGVVSNASGQIEGILRREICQVGAGPHIEMRCIVDSHVVGVAKPDPRIFDHATPCFPDVERGRIAYIGDSVTMDVGAASAAGLHPILLDPYGDHEGADFETTPSVAAFAVELLTA
jgi:putative hydrolase of the HAD superfamily